MQNLLGEGVLSASFIPVYARLLEEGRDEDAGRVAGAILGLLAVVAGVLTLLAVVFAEPLTAVLAIGFESQRRDLTATLVRIITPGVGFLVLSAWCLGILNSHRRFFLSYVAPVIWNLVQVVAVVGAGWWLLDDPLGVRPDRHPGDRRRRPGRRHARGRAGPAVGAGAGGPPAGATPAPQHPRGPAGRSTGDLGVRARGGWPRRDPAVGLAGPPARLPAGLGRGRRPVQRPAAVHAARQPVRHERGGGGAARAVPAGRGRARHQPAAGRRAVAHGLLGGGQRGRIRVDRRPAGRGAVPLGRVRTERGGGRVGDAGGVSRWSPPPRRGCCSPPCTPWGTPAPRRAWRCSACWCRPWSASC